MRTYWFSVRLPSWLASELDHTAKRLGWSVSRVAEALVRASDLYRDEFLEGSVKGPFHEKRTLRLSMEATAHLMKLAEYFEFRPGEFAWGIQPSLFFRLMFAHFFTNPRAVQAVFPHALDKQDELLLLEDSPRTGASL